MMNPMTPPDPIENKVGDIFSMLKCILLKVFYFVYSCYGVSFYILKVLGLLNFVTVIKINILVKRNLFKYYYYGIPQYSNRPKSPDGPEQ
jgi:hypothetical protein